MAALLTPFFFACQPSAEKEYSMGIDLAHVDSTTAPGADFFRFANGTWLDNTPIPEDEASYGVFYILRENSQKDVKAIIEESASREFEKGSDEQKVGDLYASYLDMDTRNANGVEPLKADFERIDQIASPDDLDDFMADYGIYGIDLPLGGAVYPDFKVPTQYALYVFHGGLGLPDREYYLSDAEQFASIRPKYLDHMVKMFEMAGLPDAKSVADDVMVLETAIAQIHWSKEENRDWAKLYNKYTIEEISAEMPKFDWSAYLKTSGVEGLDTLIIGQPSYFQALNGLLTSQDLSVWKNYLKWKVLDDAASRLSEELDVQNFNFYGKEMHGMEAQQPAWRRAVNVVNGSLGEVVSKVYVSKHFPPEAKGRMLELVNNLLKAYEQSINELDWMSDSTRAQALDKLSKFTAKIGYPDKWKDYSDVEISKADLFANIRSANKATHFREVGKLNGPIDKSEWYMTPQTVNAYYDPTKNEIVFPAAILQPPFFDMEADDAANYGAIGAIIGHEIGHGFDDQGSTFDGDGAMRNWWTESDRAEFEKRTKVLIDQYDSYQVFDDLNVNGTFTLGENIGDLGGLSIALKAYQLSLNGEEAPMMNGLTGLQRLFISYAQAWRSKFREETMRIRINTDTHSPPKFRTNGIVRNVPEWYEAFNIQEGDSLYLPPEERVKIW